MTKRRGYFHSLAGLLLVAVAAAPLIAACGSDEDTTTATPTPSATTTATTPVPPAPASCSDAKKNGTETGTDCGGSCTKCNVGQGCAVAGDCSTNICTNKVCAAASCSDTAKNGPETDVDCGGTCTAKCTVGKGCAVAADCSTGLCGTTKLCLDVSCGDTIKNGTETDVDCGGTCSTKCAVTKTCAVNGDCASGKCDSATKKCVAPGCADLVKNGNETDIDCGGTCATKCGDTKGCAAGTDCTSGLCDNATHTCTVAGCNDGVLNGNETSIDCGGSCSTKCAVGGGCAVGSDCASLSCDGATSKCVAATCNDGIKNANETDTDCGGGCAPTTKCADTKSCAAGTDCTSGVCDPGTNTCSAAACTDTVQNADETDTDCGGSCAPTYKCADTKKCGVPADCVSGVCDAATLTCTAPACNDNVFNGTETDVDCGGSCAPANKCADAKGCAAGTDCTSGVCSPIAQICVAPLCGDGVKNGDETDVDCGGACATKCAVAQSCAANGDCATGACDVGLTNKCLAIACGTADEHLNATVICPVGQTMIAITYASYGTPSGLCGGFMDGACDSATSDATVTTVCLNQNACTVFADNAVFGDPCIGTGKRLYIQATCK
ncbi:MAG: hypothetical protein JWP87_2010 [Labilithrix sp.]|nr:hypothetical protein [Labilithrix sp.]